MPVPVRTIALGPERPMTISLDPADGRSLLARRAADRRVTVFGMALAAGYLALTVLSVLAPPALRMGAWLPLHMLLAGAAATAVAGVMPFFAAGVASVPPAATPIRVAGVVGVAVGAGLVVLVRLLGHGAIDNGLLGALAGATYLAGIAAVAAATLLPLRAALGPRRAVLGVSYGVALGCLALGALVGTLAIAGWSPALAAWDVLRPTHAWINVFGFLSLVIAASMLHLLPTVAGTRIARTPASTLVLVGMMTGPVTVAVGFVTRLTPVVVVGAALVVVAAFALVWHAATVVVRRGRWTTDRPWHRFVQGSLLASVGWFAVGALLAAAVVVETGATARGWDSAVVAGPLALGWAAQALMGSWSHLVPAVGPGSPEVHARQRAVLGRWATARVVLAQVGVALVTVGVTLGQGRLVEAGLVLVGACAVAAVALVAVALAPVVRSAPRSVALDRSGTIPG
jgi:nitrite reductase (NO-forming)